MSNEKNTINFTFNFNAPVGQNIAHVDKLEAHFDKEMSMQVVDTAAICRDEAEETAGCSPERLARAIEAVQSFFWAQSSWAVVYCVCRDHLEMTNNMSEFERMVEALPFTKHVVECPEGTIRRAISNNDYMSRAIHRWPEGRARLLAEKLISEMKNEMEG